MGCNFLFPVGRIMRVCVFVLSSEMVGNVWQLWPRLLLMRPIYAIVCSIATFSPFIALLYSVSCHIALLVI